MITQRFTSYVTQHTALEVQEEWRKKQGKRKAYGTHKY